MFHKGNIDAILTNPVQISNLRNLKIAVILIVRMK